LGLRHTLHKLLGMGRKKHKILVISDIHGNAHALQAVVKQAEKEGVTDVVCLGDLIGNAAHHNETFELVRRLEGDVKKKGGSFTILTGNCDYYILSDQGRKYIRSEEQMKKYPGGARLIQYSDKTLRPENRRWLEKKVKLSGKADFLLAALMLSNPKKDLVWDPKLKQYHVKWATKALTTDDKLMLEKLGFKRDPPGAIEALNTVFKTGPFRFDAEMVVDDKIVHFSHGGPGPLYAKRFGSDFNADDAFKLVSDEVTDIIGGHNHVPAEGRTKDGRRFTAIGSVGAPKNGVPKAQFAIINGRDAKGNLLLEQKAVDYDVEAAAKAMENHPALHPLHRKAMAEAIRKGKAAEEVPLPSQKSILRRMLGF